MGTVIYERKKLYQEIWEEPVSVVAKRYSISGNALKKHCKKLNIPVPPRGYWAKVKAGSQMKKAPLPKSKGQEVIYVSKNSNPQGLQSSSKKKPLSHLEEEQRQNIIEFCNKLAILQQGDLQHPLIQHTLKYQQFPRKSQIEHREHVVNIQTSKEQFMRSVGIMNTILMAVEELGYTIKNQYYETKICIDKEEISIGIREKKKRVPHVLTEQESKNNSETFYSIRTYDYIYENQPTLYIDEWEAPRKNWRDTKKGKIEDKVGEFILALIDTAEILRVKRIKRQEEDRKWLERERQRFEEEILRSKELQKFEELQHAAEEYIKAMQILEYIDALEKNLQNITDSDDKLKMKEYINWARAKADWLNPILQKEDPILGFRMKNPIFYSK